MSGSEGVAWVGVESLDLSVAIEPILKPLAALNGICVASVVLQGPFVEAELVWAFRRDLNGVRDGCQGDS
jgi:hypothetical protein